MKEIINKIKWFIQRGKNGYADCDVWNLEEYVAKIIKESCFILAHNNVGFPDRLCKNKEEWKQILLDISFGFGSYLEMRSGIYNLEDIEFKRLQKEYKNSLKLFIKYHPELWD